MPITDEMVLAGALAVRKRRMELDGIGHEFDPAIPPSDEQLDLTRCALTAALSDQVVVPTWNEDELALAIWDYSACSKARCSWGQGGCGCANQARWAVDMIKHVLPRSFPLAPPPSSTAGEVAP